MFKKLIITILLIGNVFAGESAYTLNKYPSGTPYVRLKIPESSTQWTCFDEDIYENFLDLSLDAPVNDSIIANLEKQTTQCSASESDLKKSLRLSQSSLDSLGNYSNRVTNEYKSTADELSKEKIKKWYWGAGGGLIGMLISGLLTTYLIVK